MTATTIALSIIILLLIWIGNIIKEFSEKCGIRTYELRTDLTHELENIKEEIEGVKNELEEISRTIDKNLESQESEYY